MWLWNHLFQVRSKLNIEFFLSKKWTYISIYILFFHVHTIYVLTMKNGSRLVKTSQWFVTVLFFFLFWWGEIKPLYFSCDDPPNDLWLYAGCISYEIYVWIMTKIIEKIVIIVAFQLKICWGMADKLIHFWCFLFDTFYTLNI